MINVFYSHPTGFRFDLSESEFKQIENEIYNYVAGIDSKKVKANE